MGRVDGAAFLVAAEEEEEDGGGIGLLAYVRDRLVLPDPGVCPEITVA